MIERSVDVPNRSSSGLSASTSRPQAAHQRHLDQSHGQDPEDRRRHGSPDQNEDGPSSLTVSVDPTVTTNIVRDDHHRQQPHHHHPPRIGDQHEQPRLEGPSESVDPDAHRDDGTGRSDQHHGTIEGGRRIVGRCSASVSGLSSLMLAPVEDAIGIGRSAVSSFDGRISVVSTGIPAIARECSISISIRAMTLGNRRRATARLSVRSERHISVQFRRRWASTGTVCR